MKLRKTWDFNGEILVSEILSFRMWPDENWVEIILQNSKRLCFEACLERNAVSVDTEETLNLFKEDTSD